MREVIYTALFAALALLLLLLFVYMFLPKDNSSSKILSEPTAPTFIPGVYTSPVSSTTQSLQIEVTVDSEHINSIRLVTLDETTDVSNTLLESTLTSLTDQILSSQSLSNLTYEPTTRYTAQTLYTSITKALSKASPPSATP